MDYNAFLEQYYREAIIDAAGILEIDFHDLERHDLDAADRLLSHPDQELTKLTNALHDYLLPADVDLTQLEISIKNLPDTEKIPVHKVCSELVSKFTAVEGRISRIGHKYSKLLMGAFQCGRCTHITYLHQPNSDKLIEPFECENDVCGRRGTFKLVDEESVRIDEQKIGLQNLYEQLNPGQPTSEIIVYVRGDLTDTIPPLGAQVIINGIVRVQQGEKNISSFILEANHIETKEASIDITLTEADRKELTAIKNKGNIFHDLIRSIAPTVLGYPEIKMGLLAATVSGPNHTLSDGTDIRGYLNVLICGDPGTAKTILAKSLKPLVPRTQYAAGKGSSSVGLTVSVTKDELSGSGWAAQAGALVLADKGSMILDEMDKQSKEDIQDLNTALEHNRIEVHKAGINQTFSCRCPIIGVLNPKYARFDDDEPYTKQVNIPADTLSRFDLIFLIRDVPDKNKDLKIAEHLGKIWQQLGNNEKQQDSDIIPLETLRKYIAYAKTFNPELPDSVTQKINSYFLDLRKQDDKKITATFRDYNAICRLTLSVAKLRLSNECSIDDVEQAISIHKAAQDIIIDPTTGKKDIDVLYGEGQSQRDRIRTVRAVILEMQGTNGGTAFIDDLLSASKAKGISKEQTLDIIYHLKHQGELIEPTENLFRVVE